MSDVLGDIKNDKYPDFALSVKNKKVACHKVVMAEASPIIETSLEFKSKVPKKSNKSEEKFILDEYEFATVDYFVSWIYNCDNIKCPDAIEFLKLLDYL